MDLDPPASAPGLQIREAHDTEARACRLLLPEMFTAGQAPDLLVATVADPARHGLTRFVGAAGVGIVYGPGRSFPLMVHVVSSWRGHGIGRRLVEAAVTRCRGRADMIRALQPVPADSQAAMFLTACGFEQLDRLIHWEVDGLPFYADMLRIRQRLEQHGRVPTNAKLLRLSRASWVREA